MDRKSGNCRAAKAAKQKIDVIVRRQKGFAWEIERRPRGASRAALAPTFVSGQLFLWDLRANAWVHGSISRSTNKAVARVCNRDTGPKQTLERAQLAMRRAGGARSHKRPPFKAYLTWPGR
ncbi:hypothetical protein NPS42_07345 [Pseudomonas putida]|uniref:hypothetical protein n=1 Tax=Pseudomonas putida TaxID=303 RepID=UPI0023642720|nr:hypothetical protein [Pseudomonas putida]MDD2025623.1 hypothetical protein [Pseudomonas putida]HDS1767459.1 hypothetical protein [Pseudomonas putida]